MSRPSNDFCSNARFLSSGSRVQGTTIGASFDTSTTGGTCSSGHGPGVWYRSSGTGGLMTAHTCDSRTSYDTRLSVFSGTSCSNLRCVSFNDDYSSGAAFCSGATVSDSSVSWSSSAGTNYYILVSGFSGEFGDFGLRLSSSGGSGGGSGTPTTANPPGSPAGSPASSTSNNVGIIVGACVGGLAFIGLVVGGIVLWRYKSRSNKKNKNTAPVVTSPPENAGNDSDSHSSASV